MCVRQVFILFVTELFCDCTFLYVIRDSMIFAEGNHDLRLFVIKRLMLCIGGDCFAVVGATKNYFIGKRNRSKKIINILHHEIWCRVRF